MSVEIETTSLFSIGRFSRVSGLTVKALRHYAEIGLLRPARVDEDNGYRYYTLSQAREAEAIRRLRSLEVPLEEIRELVGADACVLRDRLRSHQARMEGRAVETRRIVAELQAIIDGRESLVPEAQEVKVRFQMDIQEVPETQVLVLEEHVRADEMSSVVPRAIDEVGTYLKELGTSPTGPPICICPSPDEDGMLDHETGWPVTEEAPGAGRIKGKTLPATRALVMKHVGPYEQLSRSYRLMREVMEEDGLTEIAPPRELYWTDPEEVPDPNDYVTDIVWPIGPDGELDKTRDHFRKRVESE